MASFAPRQDAATTTSDYTLAEGSNGTASGTTSSANGTSASLSTMNGSVATPVAAATSSVLGLSPSGGEASEASSEYGSADDQDVSMEIQMDGSEGGNSVGSLLDAEGDGDAEMMGPDSDPDHDQDQDADGEEPMRIDASLEEQDGGMMVQEDGKRVKVYELRDQSWHDRGTGHCKGIYDDSQDLALLIVEAEDTSGDKEGEGGFLKEELLLSAKVEKEDIYARQQDTLIVWTEPSGLDIALSFQDAEGCEDVWQFIIEVQRHLNNLPSDTEHGVANSSSPLSGSPMLGMAMGGAAGMEQRLAWTPPSLSNLRDQLQGLQMVSRSAPGRERTVEHIIAEDYIKNLIAVFDQAEDLESIEDLHLCCAIMQAIILLNDNGILEYILQSEVFEGVIGMLEYDREYPSLKASFRQLFREISRFRQVVEIRDPNIRNKIHQTYRVQYLKEVVLARVLDDPTFSILNGFIFFNQVDIVGHIQNNESILLELFAAFRAGDMGGTAPADVAVDESNVSVSDPSSSPVASTGPSLASTSTTTPASAPGGSTSTSASASISAAQSLPVSTGQPSTEVENQLDERRRDTVLFLHQLVLMGKSIQLANRLNLYRTLLDRGLLMVLEWAFRRKEAPIIHAAAEMLTIVSDHDVVTLRTHVVRDHEGKRGKTLLTEMITLFGSTGNLGLISQLTDVMRTMLEPPAEGDQQTYIQKRDSSVSDAFLNYFYDHCCADLFKPLLDLPNITGDMNPPIRLDRRTSTVTHHLVELLYFCIMLHSHRSSFYVLSNPVNRKVVSLLYLRDKPLRLVVTRFIKCCLKTSNHFLHRSFVKGDLFAPLVALLEEESRRDNMLTSACMLILDEVRKDNIKPIINYLFTNFASRLEALSKRPFLSASIQALKARWEQINEPPPPPPAVLPGHEAESSRWSEREKEAQQEDYFNASDDDEQLDSNSSPAGKAADSSSFASGSNSSPESGTSMKRKRKPSGANPSKRRSNPPRQGDSGPGASVGSIVDGDGGASASASPTIDKSGTGGGLGLDYDDNSDSDSAGGSSPRPTGSSGQTVGAGAGAATGDADLKPTEELAEDLGDLGAKMRAKRMREEEDEEEEEGGFVGLMGGKKKGKGKDVDGEAGTMADGLGSVKGFQQAGGGTGTPKRKILGFGLGGSGGGGDRVDTPRKDKEDSSTTTPTGAGTKVKLNWSGALRKLGGGGGVGGTGKKSPTGAVDGTQGAQQVVQQEQDEQKS